MADENNGRRRNGGAGVALLALGISAAAVYAVTRPAKAEPPSGGGGNAPGQTAIVAWNASNENPRVGEQITFGGALVDSKGAGIEGEPVEIHLTPPDAIEPFIRAETVMTGAGGAFAFAFAPGVAGSILAKATYSGNPAEGLLASSSAVIQVVVAP